MMQRLVSFAHATVALQADDARAQAILDFLFRLTTSEPTTVPYTTFQVTANPASERMRVSRDQVLLREDVEPADLAEFLLGEVTYRLLDQSREGVTLHAGALAWRGKGILVPGSIGAGKTTLTAWLTHRGLDYLTDEMVWIPHHTNDLHGFPRPLNVKPSARAVMQTFLDYAANTSQVLRGELVDLISPFALNPTNALSTPPLSLILFPGYQRDGAPRIERLSPGQTGLALAQALLNVGNLSDKGLPEIARLARLAPAYRLCYSDFAQIENQLAQLIEFNDDQKNSR